jgi:hypothetical protein
MNMKDTVTVKSSTMSKTPNSKMSVKRFLACSWVVVFTSVVVPLFINIYYL